MRRPFLVEAYARFLLLAPDSAMGTASITPRHPTVRRSFPSAARAAAPDEWPRGRSGRENIRQRRTDRADQPQPWYHADLAPRRAGIAGFGQLKLLIRRQNLALAPTARRRARLRALRAVLRAPLLARFSRPGYPACRARYGSARPAGPYTTAANQHHRVLLQVVALAGNVGRHLMPLVSRTRAILRSAEFGFFGVIVRTCVQTPRFCGAPAHALRAVLQRVVGELQRGRLALAASSCCGPCGPTD